MKFAEKYEIVEMLTSGRVSTFLARDRASQEPVVVYTFECMGTGAADLSTASIIAKFCSLAPNPPGIIVKAGFDAPSSSAFLTTKMPDAAALKAWISKYHAFVRPAPVPASDSSASDETAEISASQLKAFLAKGGRSQHPVPPADRPLADQGDSTSAFSAGPPVHTAPPSGGEFTRLFQEANAFEPVHSNRAPAPSPSTSKPGDATDAMLGGMLGKLGSPLPAEKKSAAPPPAPTTSAPTRSSPGSFTKEFLAVSNEAGPASSQNPVTSPQPPKKEPGPFTKEFLAVSQPADKKKDEPKATKQSPKQTAPSSTAFSSIFGPGSPPSGASTADSAEAETRKPGGGEFTQFFGNPFDQPGPSERSIQIPDLASSAPPRQQTGEFTKYFGQDDLASAQVSSPPAEPDERPPGSFTQSFPPDIPKRGTRLGESTLDTHPDLSSSPSDSVFSPTASMPGLSTPAPPIDLFSPRPPAPLPVASTPIAANIEPVANRPFPNRSNANDATDIFRVREAEAPPVEEISSGPSDFTRLISRGELNAGLAAESPSPAGAGQPGLVVPPPIPQPPPFQFSPPPPPPPPAIKYPPAPPVSAPPPTPKPQLPVVPAKAASYWPLITVLTVLLAIAAMLIMYFALTKH